MIPLLLLLLLALSGTEGYRWNNWQFDLTCRAEQLIVPRSEAELVSFLNDEFPRQSLIKVIGNRHSFGNLTTCVDESTTTRSTYIVELSNLLDFSVDLRTNRATFGAGWDLLDLIEQLRGYNLSVANLGTERVQNFVGAFTTGTHGTGKNLGNMATQIVGARVLSASGTLVIINETTNSEYLPAIRLSLGSLGIITQVTVQAVPLAFLKRTTVLLSAPRNMINGQVAPGTNFTALYQIVLDLYAQHERMMMWGPHMTWNETSEAWDVDPIMYVTYFEPTDVKDVRNCSTNYCANGCGVCLVDNFCYDVDVDALSTPPAGVCNRFFYAEIEHFLPVENFLDAAVNYTTHQMKEAPALRGLNNHEMIYEIRFVKGDQNWMSPVNTLNLGPGNSGVFAVIEIDWYMTYNNFTSLWAYQEMAKQYIPTFGRTYNVRSHWGKMSWFDYSYTQFIYPLADSFRSFRAKMDPNCQFVNEFLITHFNLTQCNIYESTYVPPKLTLGENLSAFLKTQNADLVVALSVLLVALLLAMAFFLPRRSSLTPTPTNSKKKN